MTRPCPPSPYVMVVVVVQASGKNFFPGPDRLLAPQLLVSFTNIKLYPEQERDGVWAWLPFLKPSSAMLMCLSVITHKQNFWVRTCVLFQLGITVFQLNKESGNSDFYR